MPVNGLVFAADEVEYGVSISGVASGGTVILDADLQTLYTPNALNLNVGFEIKLHSATATPTWSAVVTGPGMPFGGWTAGAAAVKTSISVSIRLQNVKLYATAFSFFRIVCSGIQIYLDGALQTTVTGFDQTSPTFGPSWIPQICGLVWLSGGATVAIPPGTGSGSAAGNVVGGWRFRQGANWYALPITIPTAGTAPLCGPSIGPPPPVITLCAPFSLGIPTAVSGSDTWSVSINSFHSDTRPGTGGSLEDYEHIGGNIFIIPDLSKQIVRLTPGYAAIWLRYRAPKVQAGSVRQFTIFSAGRQVITNLTFNVYATDGGRLDVVGDAAHAIEAPLTQPTYCGVQVNRDKSAGNDVEVFGYTFPVSCEDSSFSDYFAPMDHAVLIARYFNSLWVHPFWHLYHWFPPGTADTDGDGFLDLQSQWPLDGAAVNRKYWIETGDQMSRQSALPVGENRNTRLTNIASVWQENPFVWMDNSAAGNLWIGVSRWVTDAPAMPASIALASASQTAWTLTSCTVAWGADIVATSTGPSSFRLEYDMGRWDQAPYMYPHGCDRVAVDWVATNVSSIIFSWVGIDGSVIRVDSLVSGNTPPATYQRPAGLSTLYAGSWAIENGDGFTTDIGADIPAGGASLATMADSERAFAFQLLPERTAAKLRIDVTPTVIGTAVTIRYPRFVRPSAHPTVVWESRKCAALIWPNGPGIRWGNWLWYDPNLGIYFGDGTTGPEVIGLGTWNSIIDAIAWRHQVWLGDSAASGAGLTTELATMFDSYEVQSIAADDKWSHSFILPKSTTVGDEQIRTALVSGNREVAPLACFPFQERNPADWKATRPHAQIVYDQAQENRYFVAAGALPLHLKNPSGGVVSSAIASPPGWTITQEAVAVVNDEATNWTLGLPGKDYGHVRPFHGFFFVSGTPGADVVDPWYLYNELGWLFFACVQDGDVWFRRALDSGAMWEIAVQVTTGGGTSSPRHAIDPVNERMLLLFQKSNNVYQAFSDDDGEQWSSPVLVMAGASRPIPVSTDLGEMIMAFFVWDSGTSGPGTVQIQYHDATTTTFGAAVTAKDNSGANLKFEDRGFAIARSPDEQSRWSLTGVPQGDTVAKHYFSTDESQDAGDWTFQLLI